MISLSLMGAASSVDVVPCGLREIRRKVVNMTRTKIVRNAMKKKVKKKSNGNI